MGYRFYLNYMSHGWFLGDMAAFLLRLWELHSQHGHLLSLCAYVDFLCIINSTIYFPPVLKRDSDLCGSVTLHRCHGSGLIWKWGHKVILVLFCSAFDALYFYFFERLVESGFFLTQNISFVTRWCIVLLFFCSAFDALYFYYEK